MHRQKIVAGIVGLVAAAGAACAQTNATYLITFDGQVTPQNPTMTVEIWATWVDPPVEHLFGEGDYDLTAGDGLFLSGAKHLSGAGSTIGVLVGNTVTGAIFRQVHIPQFGIFGLSGNPILLATYEWTTTDFTPRSVVFETSNTTTFLIAEVLYPFWRKKPTFQLYPWAFTRGRNVYVIPAPGSAALLGVFALGVIGRGRRQRPG
ncbi:MAG: hypothetical protein IH985_00790 [Planctomycetes bacterium]|nr:hypothetical protein [Planctomycetota bacterium]